MKHNNTYIFLYASVMVVLVAALLSVASESLKETQQNNVKIEKIQNILSSVNIESTKENAQELFDKYIPAQNRIVVGVDGQVKNGIEAFGIDIKKEQSKSADSRNLPVYICQLENGDRKVILPLLGKGLWGPIWGYMSLNTDNSTVYGVTFDHKGETPGLGADINKDWFMEPFKGKTIFEGDNFVSITVHKGGKGSAERAGDLNHGVDAISGGTITSKGLEAMLKSSISDYVNYLKTNKQ